MLLVGLAYWGGWACTTSHGDGDGDDVAATANPALEGGGGELSASETPSTSADSLDTGSSSAEDGGSSATGDDEDSHELGDSIRFDLGPLPDWQLPDGDCEDWAHTPCDAASEDPAHAIGINCPGELPRVVAELTGDPRAFDLRQQFGTSADFAATEGTKYLVLGTGLVDHLDQTPPDDDLPETPTYCSDPLLDATLGDELPAPIVPRSVGELDCIAAPELVGTGDCSNSLQAQWDAGQNASYRVNDYAELRIELVVPELVHGFSFDFAFATTEYPFYFQSKFNDMFIAWLQAANWTGNVSFDELGRPITLNSSFMDFKDAGGGVEGDPDCAMGCSATQLHGTCMQGHAATRWLTTSMPVVPGDSITLVFALFDMADAMVDSYVFLDNLRWHCEAPDRPHTLPPT